MVRININTDKMLNPSEEVVAILHSIAKSIDCGETGKKIKMDGNIIGEWEFFDSVESGV